MERVVVIRPQYPYQSSLAAKEQGPPKLMARRQQSSQNGSSQHRKQIYQTFRRPRFTLLTHYPSNSTHRTVPIEQYPSNKQARRWYASSSTVQGRGKLQARWAPSGLPQSMRPTPL